MGLRSFIVACIAITLQFVSCQDTGTGTRYSIQEVAKRAVDSYFAEDYPAAIEGFESALIHYRMFKSIDETCGVKCKHPNISRELDLDFTGLDELYAYGNLLAKANCFKICVEEHPFAKHGIERPRGDYIRDIEARMPYNYLQFSYWKTGNLEKAAQAAYTYLQANPHDKQMKENMEYYKEIIGDIPLKDLESKPYQSHFQKGVKFYESEKYAEAVKNFESAISDYFVVLDECKAACHVARDPETFFTFVIAVAFRHKPVYDCMLGCKEKLQPLVGDYFVDNMVQRTYSYLQFAYFQLGKYKKAVSAAASALLLNKDDEVAISNMEYYSSSSEELGVKKTDLLPRDDAKKYFEEKIQEMEVHQLLVEVTDFEDEEEIIEDDGPDTLKDRLVQEISRQVVMEMSRGGIGDPDY